MSDALDRITSTKEGAHEAARQAYALAQVILMNGGRARIRCEEEEDDISAKQRRFLHGPVLQQISEQVSVNGERYVREVWKEYWRARFLGHRYEMLKLPGQKRATPRKVRNSTEDMGIRAYSNYIDKVIDTAVVEFSVSFVFKTEERDEVRYRAPARQAKHQREEVTA